MTLTLLKQNTLSNVGRALYKYGKLCSFKQKHIASTKEWFTRTQIT